jgi:fission process protein 1
MPDPQPNNNSTTSNENTTTTTTDDTVDHDPLTENPYLRLFGYGARIGRLLGTAASSGSRYLAYTSDVGEALRPVMDRRYVQAGYLVSWLYVVGDVSLTTKRAYDAKRDYIRAGAHAAVFQVLGSMVAPALIIHTTVHQTERLLHYLKRPMRFGPTAAGLSVVPFLPIIADRPIEAVVDYTFDKFWPSKDSSHHQHHDKHE